MEVWQSLSLGAFEGSREPVSSGGSEAESKLCIPLTYLCHWVLPLSVNMSQWRSDEVPVSGLRRVQGDRQSADSQRFGSEPCTDCMATASMVPTTNLWNLGVNKIKGDGEGPCTDCMATLPVAQTAVPLAYLCCQVLSLSANTSQWRSDKVPVSGLRRVQGDGLQTVRGLEVNHAQTAWPQLPWCRPPTSEIHCRMKIRGMEGSHAPTAWPHPPWPRWPSPPVNNTLKGSSWE